MNNNRKILFVVLIVVPTAFNNCSPSADKPVKGNKNHQVQSTNNLRTDFEPLHKDGDINAAIEIPAGTLEKWEIDKLDGNLQLEQIDGAPRIINYLGYPANYGMIPQTLLPKESGGDGDPLDVIILGPAVERGKVVKCKLIGVLYLTDHGEQDDKLIAVLADSPLYKVNSMNELNHNYNGIAKILQLWFTNYKGPGNIESKGFGNKKEALEILKLAVENYSKKSVN